MMMIPLSPEARGQANPGGVLRAMTLAVLVALVLLYVDPFRNAVVRLVEPLVLLVSSEEGSLTAISPSYRELQEEHQRLVEDVMHMRTDLLRLNALAYENSLLRESLEARHLHPVRMQGQILRRPPETLYDTLVVGVGARQGVSSGAGVSAGAAFVGRVVQVSAHTATVVLASAPGEELLGSFVQATSSYPVRLRGMGQGTFEAFVPRALSIEIDDPILLYTGRWEVVAIVASVSDSPTDALIWLTLTAPVNMWHLQTVDIAVAGDADASRVGE